MNIETTSVAIAMSGGLDSSMAASLLVEEGYACFGIMMRLWSEMGPGQASSNKCCSRESVEVARQVAHQLDIPFYLINVEEPFRQRVVDPFIQDYSHGLTPNPCLNCNRHIRFTYLLDYVQRLGPITWPRGTMPVYKDKRTVRLRCTAPLIRPRIRATC